jgi:hypothetical protein
MKATRTQSGRLRTGGGLYLSRPAYPHFDGSTFLGCSVTGGFVYRGHWSPALIGQYIFGDYCSGNFWALSRDGRENGRPACWATCCPTSAALAKGPTANYTPPVTQTARSTASKRHPPHPTSACPLCHRPDAARWHFNSGVPGDERLFVVQQPGQIRICSRTAPYCPLPSSILPPWLIRARSAGYWAWCFIPTMRKTATFM